MSLIGQVDMVRDSTVKQLTAVIAAQGRDKGDSHMQLKSYEDIQSIVKLGLAPYIFDVGDIIEVGRETAIQASLGEHTGISAVSINGDTFIAAMHEAGEKEYEISYDGSVWKYGEKPIILADYGLSVTGTAAEGDTIVVVETASTIEFVVMGFIESGGNTSITLHDKGKTYGMILQSKDILYNLQVDNTEAFYSPSTALAAGTYHVTLGDNYDTAYGGGATYQFTLTQAVPAGGQIVWPWAYNQLPTAAKISTYASGDSTTPIESNVAVTAGSGGTDLGTVLIRPTGDFNSIQRMRYGSNKWSEGSMRQHLNSDKAAGQVYKAQSKFDRPPSWATNTAGFMHGLDPEFIKICADVELLTCLSTVCDTTTTEGNAGTGYETTVDKFFLPSRPEVFGGSDNASDKGTVWDFYKINSDNPSAASVSGADSNRIKKNVNTGNPYYWWMRSPYAGYGYYVRYVTLDGNVGTNVAYNSYGVAPACVVA